MPHTARTATRPGAVPDPSLLSVQDLPGRVVGSLHRVRIGATEDIEQVSAEHQGFGLFLRSMTASILTGQPISLIWHKRRWRCSEPRCARKSFTEAIDELSAGGRTTGRLRRAIGSAVGDVRRSVAEAADSSGRSWPTAHTAPNRNRRACSPLMRPGADGSGGPSASSTGGGYAPTPTTPGFVDLAGSQRLLGQVEGRTSRGVINWLEARTSSRWPKALPPDCLRNIRSSA
jgi:hypothetical protein